MKITKAIYSESIELWVLGATRWRKVALEAELEDGEDEVKATIELKKKVDEIHKLNNVDIFSTVPIPSKKTDHVVDRMKVLLESATSRAELNKYKPQVPEELIPLWKEKHKKLK